MTKKQQHIINEVAKLQKTIGVTATQHYVLKLFTQAAKVNNEAYIKQRLDDNRYSFEAEYDPISIEQSVCPECLGRALVEKFYNHEHPDEFFKRTNTKQLKYNTSLGFERSASVTQVRCKEWRAGCGKVFKHSELI